MTIPVLPPLTAPMAPVPTITPFNYRDGITYLKRLEGLAEYVNKVIVPYVNLLGDTWTGSIDEIKHAVDAAVAAIAASVVDADKAQAAAEAAAAAANAAAQAAQLAAQNAAGANDTAMTAIWNNVNSAFRIALNSFYAKQSDLNTLTATVTQLQIDVSGKVSQTDFNNLVTVVGTKASDADVTALENTVDNGRLSATNIDARFKSANNFALAAMRRGRYTYDTRFSYLRNGAADNAQDTRVVLLGDSNATGGGAAYKSEGQGYPQRLADMCGSPLGLIGLNTVSSAPAPGGMKWWQGAAGGLSSGNYGTTDKLNAINLVDPQYVFHFIGSNDYAQQIPVDTFKANVRTTCETIEANTPGVFNVIVTEQARVDDLSRPIKESQYRQALKEVAELKTDTRIFIDIFDGMDMFGTDGNNRSGMVIDGIHMGSVGNAYTYEILSAYIGLPTPNVFSPYNDPRPFDFAAGATLTVNTVIAQLSIEAANYPRLARVHGRGLFTPSAGNGTSEVNVRLLDGYTTGPILETATFRLGEAVAKSRPIEGEFVIHSREAKHIDIQIAVGTGTVIVTNTPNVLNAKLILSPM